MVVRKLFRIAFALFLEVHRIALHRIRIALFAYFSHFRTFFTFLVVILQLMLQTVVKIAKKCAKYAKKCENAKNAKKCEKLRNAMRKWNQNLHSIASHYYEENFSHFCIFCIAFASHYHPC
jgi:hypothetical protein